MKLIINTSNLILGGGVQVAHSFLEELKAFGQDRYFVFLSPQLHGQLDLPSYPNNFVFFGFPISPANIKKRSQVNEHMNALEKQINPDAVFSVFGPSYWRPTSIHIMGFAFVWAINPNSCAYSKLSLRNNIRIRLLNRYVKYFVKRDGDHFIAETDAVKAKMITHNWSVPQNISVVGNTFHEVFLKSPTHYRLPVEDNKFRLITISALHPHKNLQIIREVIPFLERLGANCRFYLTIPQNIFARQFSGLSDWVTNLGPVPISDCPSIYKQCDALFLPTLLECFSASYPEAMQTGLPILTSDLDFAHGICGEAAEYFNPLDPKSIAETIAKTIEDKDRQKRLVQLGKLRLRLFPTARARAESYISICKHVANSEETLS